MWGRLGGRPHNFLAMGAIAPIAPVESAPMHPGCLRRYSSLVQFLVYLRDKSDTGQFCRDSTHDLATSKYDPTRSDKKAQLMQGLRTTAPSFQDGR